MDNLLFGKTKIPMNVILISCQARETAVQGQWHGNTLSFQLTLLQLFEKKRHENNLTADWKLHVWCHSPHPVNAFFTFMLFCCINAQKHKSILILYHNFTLFSIKTTLKIILYYWTVSLILPILNPPPPLLKKFSNHFIPEHTKLEGIFKFPGYRSSTAVLGYRQGLLPSFVWIRLG